MNSKLDHSDPWCRFVVPESLIEVHLLKVACFLDFHLDDCGKKKGSMGDVESFH